MFNFLRKKIGIIGFGNMGQAIAERISLKYAVSVFEKNTAKTKGLSGVTVVSDISRLLQQNQAIILAIKPQDFEPVMAEIKDNLQDRLVISIAAGITTEYIQKVLGMVRVVRVMPNLAVKVGQSTTSICKGAFATDIDLEFVEKLFKYLGTVFILAEDMMDAATAIAGSGPAYIFYDVEINKLDPLNIPKDFKEEYIKRLKDAGIKLGFDSEVASRLSIDTVSSGESLLAGTDNSPAQLRKMVTSPGGTTEAALKVITNGGSWSEAAVAAKKRAQELSIKACLPAVRE
jgi:pyrroline-5-carboxylate reductase